jgi:transcriptional regulator with XRE-family HTH domain
MFTSDAFQFFGSPQAVAEQLGITRQAVAQWEDIVPPASAIQLSRLSRGKLKIDPDLYEGWHLRKNGKAKKQRRDVHAS